MLFSALSIALLDNGAIYSTINSAIDSAICNAIDSASSAISGMTDIGSCERVLVALVALLE